MSRLRIITFGAGSFGDRLAEELGEWVRVARGALDCIGEGGAASACGARVVLLIGPEAGGASEEMGAAVREVAPRAILLCDGGAEEHRGWCDGVYDPDESASAFVERLELLWLLGLPRGPRRG